MLPTESKKSGILPETAVAALLQGNKIAAIKIVREARHIDLKDAKDAVDEYVRTQHALQQKFAANDTEAKRSMLRIIIILALAAAGIYWLATK
jgi:ribosomal protein L7/L12